MKRTPLLAASLPKGESRKGIYFVQAFNTGMEENLKADASIACKTETNKRR